MSFKYPIPKSDLYKKIDRTISPKCEMFEFGKQNLNNDNENATNYYFYSADFLVNNLKKFFTDEGISTENKTILDFAAGYGRISRFFKPIFKEVTCSDLDQSMLDFNKENLGIDGFKSEVNIEEKFNVEKKFDVVFCFSLFTHFNPNIWEKWFMKVFDLVEEGGYFIMSTRGPELVEKILGKKMEEDMTFAQVNETKGRLDPSYYGSISVSPKFVEEKTLTLKNISLLKYYSMAKCDLFQDVYIFQKI